MKTISILNITGRSKLSNAVTHFHYNTIGLTERWLIYRSHRSNREGIIDKKSAQSGVLIAVKTDADSESVKIELPESCIAVKLNVHNTETVICTFHNPPKSSKYRYTYEGFDKDMKNLKTKQEQFSYVAISIFPQQFANQIGVTIATIKKTSTYLRRMNASQQSNLKPGHTTHLTSPFSKTAKCLPQMIQTSQMFSIARITQPR